MQEVRMDLSMYDDLQNRIRTKTDRINALEQEIEKLKHDHEEEIDKLTKEGKVKVIERPFSVMEMLVSRRCPKTEYKGFDDVRKEVEDQFTEDMLYDEVEKRHKKLLDELDECKETILKLKLKVKRLTGRNLWKRIRNK